MARRFRQLIPFAPAPNGEPCGYIGLDDDGQIWRGVVHANVAPHTIVWKLVE